VKLIVGLGNPDAQYERTRHNVGFMVIDRLLDRHPLGTARDRFHARSWDGRIGDQKVMLLKPQTYMNRSGLTAAEASSFYKLEAEDLLVVVDDTALPVGRIRLRGGGSPGGHNGLADVQQRLGTPSYPRLRVGVGEPKIDGRKIPLSDYVLSPFTDDQRRDLEPALDRAVDAVEHWLTEGLAAAMNRTNAQEADGGTGSPSKTPTRTPDAPKDKP